MVNVLYDPFITSFNNKAKLVLSKDYMEYVDLAFLSMPEYYDVVVDYLLKEKNFQHLAQEEIVKSIIASNIYIYIYMNLIKKLLTLLYTDIKENYKHYYMINILLLETINAKDHIQRKF